MTTLIAVLTCALAAQELPPVGPEALAAQAGVPMGEARISERLARYRDFDSRLKVQDGRVLGLFKACDSAPIGETPDCAEVWFSFPEVRVDRAAGKLTLHGEIVGKLGNGVFTGPRPASPWRLRHRVGPDGVVELVLSRR